MLASSSSILYCQINSGWTRGKHSAVKCALAYLHCAWQRIRRPAHEWWVSSRGAAGPMFLGIQKERDRTEGWPAFSSPFFLCSTLSSQHRYSLFSQCSTILYGNNYSTCSVLGHANFWHWDPSNELTDWQWNVRTNFVIHYSCCQK